MPGLSARALSALEPYGVATVGDLVAVDPVRLNRLSGVAEATRREVKARARQWRDKFGAAVTGRGQDRQTAPVPGSAALPDPGQRRPSCSWPTPGRPGPRRGAPRPACCSDSTPGSTPSPARTN